MTPVGTEARVGGFFGEGSESARIQLARVICEMPGCLNKDGSGRVIKRKTGRGMGIGSAALAEVYQAATEHDNNVHAGKADPKLLKVNLSIGH